MRILFSTSSLFPYRVNWLDELGKYADVDVYYLMDKDSARNTQWCSQRPENCTYTLMKSIKVPRIGRISFDFIKVLKRKAEYYDIIILDGYGYATQILNILFLNNRHIYYYVNIDGMVPKEQENCVLKWLKRQMISRFPGCLCGAYNTNEQLLNYGAKAENIANHPFTSLYQADVFQNIAATTEKKQLRKMLNIQEEKVIMSVGRFSYMNGYGKGYDVLLRAATQLSENIGWYIVGGQPTEEFATMKDDLMLENFHFVDFMKKDVLEKYYRAADIFVLMTVSDVWGLVINEAMACGLPVITTDKCVAGLDLVTDGENGYIVNVGDDKALAKRIKQILEKPGEVTRMGQQSLKAIREYTIETMAKKHMEIFKNRKKNNFL